MIKKLTLLAMAVAALAAFAIPAAASATVTLQDETGANVKVGSFVTAYSENTETTSGSGNLVCGFVGITGKVTANGPAITISETSVTVPTNCTFAGVLPAHVTASVGSITLTTSGGTASNVTFTSLITGLERTCHFANSSMPVTWGTNSVSLGGATNLTGTGAGCPTSAEIHGDFGLFSDDGHTQELSIVED